MVGYVWQQPVDLLIVLSASILMSYIPSSFLEPDWFTLNVDQILSFPCLKHTRTFPSQNKIWGLSYGLLAPFMFWHPAISLTSFPTTLLLTLLPFCCPSRWSSSQVRFTPSLRAVLWLTQPWMLFSQILLPLIQVTFQSLDYFLYFVWISTYHYPATYSIFFVYFLSLLEWRLGLLVSAITPVT